MRLLRAFFLSAICLSCLAVFSLPAWGQTNASLRGTVTDQSGGVIVGAKVTLTNTGTGISHTTISANDGSYLFEGVQVGKYKVAVEKSGFETFIQAGITLELNQNGRVDVPLRVGQESSTIEVTANAVQVDTTGAVLGKVESQRMINDLPLVDRDTLQLGLLQAGVFPADDDDSSGNPFSVSGQRSESLTFLLDGGDNTSFLGNNIVVSPNPDAVQEFKILTNNYDAQYGRTSGGIVNQITKSGTNNFHGDAFEFLRNNIFNSRNYFFNASDQAPPFKRNVFGGTLGGPIKKDKTFFFVAYQGARRNETVVGSNTSVLTDAQRTGDFSSDCPTFDGSGNCTSPTGTQLVNPITGANYPFNQVPVNPVIANYIKLYLPESPSGAFTPSGLGITDDDQGVLHLDHTFGPHDTLSFVYVIDDQRQNLPQSFNGPGVVVPTFDQSFIRTQVGSLSWSHTFSPTLVNEFRVSANRDSEHDSIPTDKTTPSALGFTNVNPDDPKGVAPPVITTIDFNLGPSPQGPTKLGLNSFRFTDNVTWTRGKHEIKFGGDIARIENNFNFDFFNNGGFDFGGLEAFTGDSMADFVGGFWDNYFQASNAVYDIRTSAFSVFAQDTWKITPRLTINYGLRYEYFTPQTDTHNNILGFFPGKQSVVFPDAPPGILYPGDPGTPNRALAFPNYLNFAPRFGFAWDMFGNAKLVMRGGGGIFYDLEDGALNLQFGGEPPFGAQPNPFPTTYFNGTTQFTGDPVADPWSFISYTTGIPTPNPFPFAKQGLVGTFLTPKIGFGYTTFPHFRTPYSENFNFGFEWQATKDTMVEAEYVGSLGRRLISGAETNFPVPSVMMQQLANFGTINTDCARPLAACEEPGGSPVTGPNADQLAFPTGATQLLTNKSNGLSDSDQLQITVDKRFSKSFAFRAAYTLAKTIDLTSGFRARSSQFTDPLDPRLDRAVADFDTPQRFVLSGVWELPFDRRVHSDGLLKKVAKGWQANGILSLQKGFPYTLFSNGNASGQNNFLDRPDKDGPVPRANPKNINGTFTSDCLGGTSTGNFYIDPTNLVCSPCPNTDPTCTQAGDIGVPLFTFGTLPRNSLRGPGINNWDISIFKNTPIGESKSVQFRTEFFNAFNHTQFANPDNSGFSSLFGQVISTREAARIIQFGLKFYF